MRRTYAHISEEQPEKGKPNHLQVMWKPFFRFMICMIFLFVIAITYFPNIQVYAGNEGGEDGDWVKIVSVTPNYYDNYTDSVTFTATINYSLQSKDEGIVYLGFNTQDAHHYVVDTSENARQVVTRGTGTVVLYETVTPVNWNTSLSFMQQFLNGYSELVKDFKIYANLSEYPHDTPWTPLAIDEAVITDLPETSELPETADDLTFDIRKRTFEFLDPETVEISWGWKYILDGYSFRYNNDMAAVALTLSAAAERSQTDIHAMLKGDNFYVDNIKSVNYGEANEKNNPACTFAHKTVDDGGEIEHIIIIVGRGTVLEEEGDLKTDLASATDHFKTPAANVWRSYSEWLNTSGLADEITAGNTKFFVTGHSLGGAVANRIAYKLTEDYGNKNVYAYTFGTPPTEGQKSTVAPNIFNVLCGGDPVPYMGAFTDGRYGVELWFQESCSFSIFNPLLNHFVQSYMTHLLGMPAFRYHISGGGIWCPVDIRIYNSSGQLVGSVTDNIVDEDSMTDSVIILLSGENNDKKNFYFLKNDTYTIEFTATDKGTLTYMVRNTCADKETIDEIVYENVKLYEGKKMISAVSVKYDFFTAEDSGIDNNGDADSDLSNVKLYVLDKNGDIQSEVQPDGKGTEIPVSTETGTLDTGNLAKVPDVTGNGGKKPDNTDSNNKESSIKVKEIKISGISQKIAPGKKISLKAAVFPANATDKTVTWKSDNKKYATVSSEGVVRIKKKGKGKTVTITATAKDGSGTKASYKIKCMKGTVKKVAVAGKSSRTVKAGSSFRLKVKVTASKGANKTLKWKSGNEKYAAVSRKGVVNIKKKGKGKTVRIVAQATDGSGKKAVIKLKITK